MPLTREEAPGQAATEKKSSALPWIIGCLVALVVLPVMIGIIGLLAAIAIPAFVQYRDDTQSTLCINNLRQIQHAKEVAAVRNGYTNGTRITPELLEPLIDGGIKSLECPGGGVYRIRPIGTEPECTVHGTISGLQAGDADRARPAP